MPALKFHIVYLPHTVKYLSFFVHSLLEYSDCSFCLVSNGCTLMEQAQLRDMCSRHPRLEYHAIPTLTPWVHAQALNYLQARTTEEYFAFLDSDIFATNRFLEPLIPTLDSSTACFSASPLWITKADERLPENFQVVSGHHQYHANGNCLGSTYFAVYETEILTELMQKTGIGFDGCCWEQIPRHYQLRLTQDGLNRKRYDTGKLLNFLLRTHDLCDLSFIELPELVHIGGYTFESIYQSQAATDTFAQELKPVVNAEEYATICRQREAQRNPVRRFFFHQLQAIFEDKHPPTVPSVGNLEIDIRIERANRALMTTWREFQERKQNSI